ncbi:MAG: 23S rRNA (adenine(2503)-C(2))-methyltransferase RlmN [Candidatus Omnitrophota bacterium]
MQTRDIQDLSFVELSGYFCSRCQESFRAKQIFEWLYQKGAGTFADMTNLPQGLRDQLEKDFSFNAAKVIEERLACDGTKKILFSLTDKEKIETVLIPAARRMTACLSTQVGCKFGCQFCASGIGGFKRNLSCSEILSQVLYARQAALPVVLSHIVFMGIGEPLDNYDNVLKAIRIINSPEALGIAARRITISTCGLVPEMKRLAQEGLQIELSVSLHGYDQTSRDLLMPVSRKYPLADLMAACREHIKKTRRQITFEYILLEGVTCHEKAAKALASLLKGMLCKVNLIAYNPVSEFARQCPSPADMMAFKNKLSRLGIHSTIRMPRGQDVSAACGQLRRSVK